MALVKCAECGKRVSSSAASCPHCGAPVLLPAAGHSGANAAPKVPGKPASRTAWLVAALVLVTIIGALARKGGGSGLPAGLAASNAADPICNVQKTDGSSAGRDCDLRELCADVAFYDRKVSEAAARGDAAERAKASANLMKTLGWLGEYRREDVAAYCSPQAVSRAGLESAPTLAAPVAAGPGDGTCGTPPLELFHVGLVYSPRDFEKHVAAHCPGASLGADGVVTVKWQGKQVAVELTKLTPELFQVRAIRALQ